MWARPSLAYTLWAFATMKRMPGDISSSKEDRSSKDMSKVSEVSKVHCVLDKMLAILARDAQDISTGISVYSLY